MIPKKIKINWEKHYFRYEGLILVLNVACILFFGWQVLSPIVIGGNWNFLLLSFGFFWLVGGQYMLSIESRGMIFDSLMGSSIHFFYRQPINKYTFLKLTVPKDCNYSLEELKEFFYYIHSSQQFSDYSSEKQFNYGIGSYEACFDIVISQYDVEVYLAISTLNLNYYQNAFEYFLKEIKYELSDNPFHSLPKKWNDQQGAGGYDCLAGMALGYTMDNLYHSDQIDLNQNANFPMDNIVEQIQKQLQSQTVYLQYVFNFENAKLQDTIRPQVKKLRQKIYDRFALRQIRPTNNKEVVEILLPDVEKKRLDRMEKRVKESSELVSSTIKVMALCTAQEYSETEKILEKSLKGNHRKTRKEENEIEIIYYTATNQRYFNLNGKPSPHSVPYMNDLYYFPPSWLEPFVSNWYDNIFYYNENRWRRQVIYKRMLSRSGQAPWRNKNTILDLNTLVSVFQIPKTGTRKDIKKGNLHDLDLLRDYKEMQN
jgi:hypothetical protein